MLLFIYICKFICHGRHIMRVIVLFFSTRYFWSYRVEVPQWIESGLSTFFLCKMYFFACKFFVAFICFCCFWLNSKKEEVFKSTFFVIYYSYNTRRHSARRHKTLAYLGGKCETHTNCTPIKPLWNSVADYIGIFL